ncbi:hypothetical protein [Jiella pelagia]|uniref:Uncharacterized protein n=1 Tax=Jiella pelagia TaxID=2986949 RepID=A0ABY7C0Y9_9HYPH|nr:hypothetical protein [Jiella pelagia]WAP68886.1 hypothetical protein OH818_27350 [Jiella pelagia]
MSHIFKGHLVRRNVRGGMVAGSYRCPYGLGELDESHSPVFLRVDVNLDASFDRDYEAPDFPDHALKR